MDLSSSSLEEARPILEPLRFEFDVHDRQQLEIELAYPLARDQASTYSVETFVFVPRNFGVSPTNYPREDFYGDLTAYLRLDSPALSISQLADLTCAESPLYQLDEALTLLEKDSLTPLKRPIIALVKLFGHAFRESLRITQQQLRRQIDALADLRPSQREINRKALLQSIRTSATESRFVLQAFRKMKRRFTALALALPVAVSESFQHVDEYTSGYLCEQFAQLSKFLECQKLLYDGSCFVATAMQTIFYHAQETAKESVLEGFVSPDENRPYAAEFFTYQRGLIKKSMHQTFYLETRELKRGSFLSNAIAMLGTGLAAIWTLLVGTWIVAPKLSKEAFNETTLVMLIGTVIAYMLRDRIQELTKSYLSRRLRNYDHDTSLHGEQLMLLGLQGIKGRARELMNWLTPAQLPTPILELRKHPRTVSGTDVLNEEVIYYNRTLTLGPEENGEFPPGFALRDILRLNLRNFMVRIDEPVDEVQYFDLQKSRFMAVQAPKVYHLNVILRVLSSAAGEILLCRYRVVLNKERILRVEKVFHSDDATH